MCMLMMNIIVGSDLRGYIEVGQRYCKGSLQGCRSEKEHVSCLNLCQMKMCMQGLEFTAWVYFICGRVGWGT